MLAFLLKAGTSTNLPKGKATNSRGKSGQDTAIYFDILNTRGFSYTIPVWVELLVIVKVGERRREVVPMDPEDNREKNICPSDKEKIWPLLRTVNHVGTSYEGGRSNEGLSEDNRLSKVGPQKLGLRPQKTYLG
ncbi:hypothetical protein HAX54_049362 [Datura stramonium]|uniref:Uncharacterized protein n=1 Tax=Datura stramonium TaxID=4076 RepID=A0ABS8SV54_DATST|nr:hypothetical protein [Datura stramonium]